MEELYCSIEHVWESGMSLQNHTFRRQHPLKEFGFQTLSSSYYIKKANCYTSNMSINIKIVRWQKRITKQSGEWQIMQEAHQCFIGFTGHSTLITGEDFDSSQEYNQSKICVKYDSVEWDRGCSSQRSKQAFLVSWTFFHNDMWSPW